MCMDCHQCGPERDDYQPRQCSGCDCGLGEVLAQPISDEVVMGCVRFADGGSLHQPPCLAGLDCALGNAGCADGPTVAFRVVHSCPECGEPTKEAGVACSQSCGDEMQHGHLEAI